ncbi:uncharacterized protein ACBR49_002566 [Aulostomus maculatus]
MNMTRKRSVVWRFFKATGPDSRQCLLCKIFLSKHGKGTTTAMLRHLRTKHPAEVGFTKKNERRRPRTLPSNGQQLTEADDSQFCSVEVVLEEGDSYANPAVNEADFNSEINNILGSAEGGPVEQETEDASGHHPPKSRRNPRSLIWKYFERLESSARCRICKKELQFFDGSTSNLHRHMLKRHPGVSRRAGDVQKPPPSISTPGSSADTSRASVNVGVTEQRELSEEPEENPYIIITNDADVDSANNGVIETAKGGSVGQGTEEEASAHLPSKLRRTPRSSIWRHFEYLDTLAAARCRICQKKLQCYNGSTGNLHRHMLKRHPEMSQQKTVTANSAPAPMIGITEQREFSDAASGGERRVFRRERELIEALRRAQREEAQALEHQRELVERLRAVNAQEAAAEKEKIEILRKAQQEEAEDLSRQREELKIERAELQKKWEELEQEKEELLFSRGHSASCSYDKLSIPQ